MKRLFFFSFLVSIFSSNSYAVTSVTCEGGKETIQAEVMGFDSFRGCPHTINVKIEEEEPVYEIYRLSEIHESLEYPCFYLVGLGSLSCKKL